MVRDSAAKLHTKALLPARQPFPVLPAWIFPTSRQVLTFPGSPYIPCPHRETEDASLELSPGTRSQHHPGCTGRLKEEANIHFPDWAVPHPAPCTGFLILRSPRLCFPPLFRINKRQPRKMGTRDRNRHMDGGQGKERSRFQGRTESRRGRPEWVSRTGSPRKTTRA